MDIFTIGFWDIVTMVGLLVIAIVAIVLILSAIALVLLSVFHKKGKFVLPYFVLSIISTLEVPVERLIKFFQIEGIDVDLTISQLRNRLNKNAFSKIPANERALFLPQCLRNPNCPARMGDEGIYCINCGQCGIGEIKADAENLGYKVFIAPGGSLVKRMCKRYEPKAVLGVGCAMEIKEGSALIESYGIPVQSVGLLRDGCLDTRVDVFELMKHIYLGINIGDEQLKYKSDKISAYWNRKKQKIKQKQQKSSFRVNLLLL